LFFDEKNIVFYADEPSPKCGKTIRNFAFLTIRNFATCSLCVPFRCRSRWRRNWHRRPLFTDRIRHSEYDDATDDLTVQCRPAAVSRDRQLLAVRHKAEREVRSVVTCHNLDAKQLLW